MAKSTNKTTQKKSSSNDVKMKVLTLLGVIVLMVSIVYLMYYFFVKKNNLQVNMSTEKKIEYIMLEGQKELITTQKFVSDLNYSMRYDVDQFNVFKYKNQDIYQFIKDERVLLVVEKSSLPNHCEASSLEMEYHNCFVTVDNYTEEYYISTNGLTYRITVKSPNNSEYKEGVKARMDYMINTFNMILE